MVLHLLAHSFLDGYCSTVQGLLDWCEVDLGFPELCSQKRRILRTKEPCFTRKRGVLYTPKGLILHTKEAYCVGNRVLCIYI